MTFVLHNNASVHLRMNTIHQDHESKIFVHLLPYSKWHDIDISQLDTALIQIPKYRPFCVSNINGNIWSSPSKLFQCGVTQVVRVQMTDVFFLSAKCFRGYRGYRVNTGPISKIFSGISSATIGMKLWFAPQISEHCP